MDDLPERIPDTDVASAGLRWESETSEQGEVTAVLAAMAPLA